MMLSVAGTRRLLARMLAAGHPEIDAVLESLVALCREDVRRLMADRDAAFAMLANRRRPVHSRFGFPPR